jgi:Carboxypeptidase regulatory-like domain
MPSFRIFSVHLAGLIACVVLTASLARVDAASGSGSIQGRIVGPDGAAMPSVPVLLRNDITGFHAQTVSDAQGRFDFFDVPFNPYELHVEVQGFQPIHKTVDVRTSLPLQVILTLKLPAVTATVTVTGEPTAAQLETDTSVSHIDIDKSYIAKAPAAVASRAMEQIITSTPGFAKDENGRFHFQGAHSQSEYVVDGQTISDQTGVSFSNSIDPGIAQSMEVIYGNVPAEYGEKMGAVINLVTRSGLGYGGVKGDAYTGASRFSTYEAGASVGYGTQSFGLFTTLDASKSDRFLDPVNFSNFNNNGDTERGFLRLDFASPDFSNTVRLTALLGRTYRDVPDTFTQAAAGQHQTVSTADQNYNVGWQSVLSSTSALDVTLFARTSDFTLYPSAGDTPVTAISHRSLDNYGATPTLTWASGIHEVKVGAVYKRFPITERFEFGLTDPSLNDPASSDYNPNLAAYDLTRGGTLFEFRGSRAGTYYAGFVQDNIHAKNFTANVGVRYDHNNLPVNDSQFEPRVGVAYYIPATRTVLRASYNRVLYTPEYENILFSSSAAADSLVPPAVKESRGLGGGILLIHSERQNAYDAGLQQAIGSKIRLDIDFWERRAHYSGDQDQFQNTGIVFPVAFSSGKYHGWNVRIDLAETAGFRGFLSAGHTHAIYDPPVVGGLFLDEGALDNLTGGPFLIDHDQNLQIEGSLLYTVGQTGLWLGADGRYDSGLVTGASPADLAGDPDNAFAAPYIRVHSGTGLDPNRIEPRTIWNFSLGQDLARYGIPISVDAALLNAFDKKGLYNILSTFGGTHVIPPRTWAVRVQYSF